MTVDINCDLGELNDRGYSKTDEAIMPFITSANIACGLHAGSPLTMEKTVLLAKKYGVAAGAHPGYPDRENFGRRSLVMSMEELRAMILFQVGAMKAIAESSGMKLQHVKCHGALYNNAASDYEMSLVIAKAVRDIDSSLIFVGLNGSELLHAAEYTGLAVASEVFADRAYNDDGSLVSRKLPGAVISDTNTVIERAKRMAMKKEVVTISGKIIRVSADTICIHGDSPMAPEFAKGLVTAFREAGIRTGQMGKKQGDV